MWSTVQGLGRDRLIILDVTDFTFLCLPFREQIRTIRDLHTLPQSRYSTYFRDLHMPHRKHPEPIANGSAATRVKLNWQSRSEPFGCRYLEGMMVELRGLHEGRLLVEYVTELGDWGC